MILSSCNGGGCALGVLIPVKTEHFACLWVALLSLFALALPMPHLRSAASRAIRLERARERGFVIPAPAGKTFIAVDSPVSIRARTAAAGLALHQKLNAINEAPSHSLARAALAARQRIGDDGLREALKLNRAVGRAKHSWTSAVGGGSVASPGVSPAAFGGGPRWTDSLEDDSGAEEEVKTQTTDVAVQCDDRQGCFQAPSDLDSLTLLVNEFMDGVNRAKDELIMKIDAFAASRLAPGAPPCGDVLPEKNVGNGLPRVFPETGMRVMLHGLRTEKFNGALGTVASLSDERAGVLLDGAPSPVSIKYANLFLIGNDLPSPSAPSPSPPREVLRPRPRAARLPPCADATLSQVCPLPASADATSPSPSSEEPCLRSTATSPPRPASPTATLTSPSRDEASPTSVADDSSPSPSREEHKVEPWSPESGTRPSRAQLRAYEATIVWT